MVKLIDDNTVSMSLEEYVQLLDSDVMLNYLHNGGVDNWDWYGDSLEDYECPKVDEVRDNLKKK